MESDGQKEKRKKKKRVDGWVGRKMKKEETNLSLFISLTKDIKAILIDLKRFACCEVNTRSWGVK